MRTSFHHQSEAQPPNGPLTAATSPDTPSLGSTTQSRMGRSCGGIDDGTMISRHRFIGIFVHGMRRTSRSLSTTLRGSLGAFAALS